MLPPSNAPSQRLPAAAQAMVRVNGITSRSEACQTSFSIDSTFLRSSKHDNSRIVTAGLDFASGIWEECWRSISIREKARSCQLRNDGKDGAGSRKSL